MLCERNKELRWWKLSFHTSQKCTISDDKGIFTDVPNQILKRGSQFDYVWDLLMMNRFSYNPLLCDNSMFLKNENMIKGTI